MKQNEFGEVIPLHPQIPIQTQKQNNSASDIDTAKTLLVDSMVDTASDYEKLQPSINDTKAAHDILSDSMIDSASIFEKLNNQQPLFDFAEFGTISDNIKNGFDETDLLMQQTIEHLKGELKTNEEIASARNSFQKEADKLYPKYTGVFKRLTNTLDDAAKSSMVVKTGLGALGGVVSGVSKSFDSEFSEYLNQPMVKALTTTVSGVVDRAKDAYNDRQARKRSDYTQERMTGVLGENRGIQKQINALNDKRTSRLIDQDSTTQTPTVSTPMKSIHSANVPVIQRDSKELDVLKSIDETTQSIRQSMMLKTLITMMLNKKPQLPPIVRVNVDCDKGKTRTRVSGAGGTDLPDSEKNKDDKTKDDKTKTKDNKTKPTKTRTPSKGGKGGLFKRGMEFISPVFENIIDFGLDNVDKIKNSGAMQKVSGVGSILGANAVKGGVQGRSGGGIGSAIGAIVGGLYGAYEVGQYLGVFDKDEKKGSAVLDPNIEHSASGAPEDALTLKDAQPVTNITHSEAIRAEKDLEEVKTKSDKSMQHQIQAATAELQANSNMLVSNVNNNSVNNNYGSAFGFDQGAYQSNYDKGSQIIR